MQKPLDARVRLLCVSALCWSIAVPALAQAPAISVATDIVSPGAPVAVTITGGPGLNLALIGSSTGAGFSYGGVGLAVGPDVQILFIGSIDGTGQHLVNIAPPFVGTALDRYYLQAVTSPSSNFLPLFPSTGLVLRNNDLLSGLGVPGPAGPPGPTGPTGPAGPTGPQGAAATIAALAGLAGNGTAAAPLAVDFDADGVQNKVSRSDHTHAAPELQAGALGSGVTIPGAQVSGTVSNAAALGGLAPAAFALAADQAGGPFFACGTLAQIEEETCALPSFSPLAYQYAMDYNSAHPLPIVCTRWNSGLRIYNATPFLTFSDNATLGMRYGGFIFMRGTLDPGDLGCAHPNWHHYYWALTTNNAVSAGDSNGCLFAVTIYCRKR